MSKKTDLSQEEIKTILDYDPCSGVFTWKKSPANSVKTGSIAGSRNSEGYINISVLNKVYRAHNLAWLYTYGKFPDGFIDHKNLIREDNRICNLREATKSQNAHNVGLRKDNKSGAKGVRRYICRGVDTGLWIAQGSIQGSRKHIGYFSTKDDAVAAYMKFEVSNFAEFARLL